MKHVYNPSPRWAEIKDAPEQHSNHPFDRRPPNVWFLPPISGPTSCHVRVSAPQKKHVSNIDYTADVYNKNNSERELNIRYV